MTRGQALERLTLSEAIERDELEAFAAQAEAEGIGPIDRAEFEASLGRVIKAPQQEDRTSH